MFPFLLHRSFLDGLRLSVGVEPPFNFIRCDLLRGWTGLILERPDSELVLQLDRLPIQLNIGFEHVRNCRFFINCLPRTLRLARPAIDTFVRIYVELVRKVHSVVTNIFVNAIDRTDADASGIETIDAEPGYYPRHNKALARPTGNLDQYQAENRDIPSGPCVHTDRSARDFAAVTLPNSE
jgi:hypothetical protein